MKGVGTCSSFDFRSVLHSVGASGNDFAKAEIFLVVGSGKLQPAVTRPPEQT